MSFSSSASFGAIATTGISEVDERERPVLELARGVGLGVDVADLLQLQRAFERDRIVHAAAEEERVLLRANSSLQAMICGSSASTACTATGRWRSAFRC